MFILKHLETHQFVSISFRPSSGARTFLINLLEPEFYI